MESKIKKQKESGIATTHPQIAAQWHPTLNGELTPNDVKESSIDRVWWLCDRGHKWKTEVRVRCQKNKGCPCCNGRYVVKGKTDIESQRPDLAKQWDFEENGDYTPDKASIRSPLKIGWVCDKGHKWIAAIENRTQRNQGCPYCSGRRAVPGETDIATQNPELMSLWDYEKNAEEGIYPENIKPYSDVQTWWKCEKGHSWQTMTKILVSGSRCPYCSGKRVFIGETDLATVNPKLASEWHPNKNKKLKPSDVLPQSNQHVWWKCTKGHEWIASIYHRSKGTGCPYCSGKKSIVGKTDLATTMPEIVEEWNYDRNIGETPQMFTKLSNKKVWWKCTEGHEWMARICGRTRGTGCPFCSGNKPMVGETDLATILPDIVEEWNYDRNIGKTPQMFTKNSGQKIWWKCTKGHEWMARICDRTRGTGCPYCLGRKPIVGETDLETLMPEIVEEWNYDRNIGKTPQMFTKNSGQKVWWKCTKGHEWTARIIDRIKGTGCPYCSGKKSIIGETDLATIMPEIAEEWNYDRNIGKTPQMFTKQSNQSVWWKCTKGHEWKAPIDSRVNTKTGCPYCLGRKPIVGETDLATLMPDIAEEWNYDRNIGKTPQMFTKSSGKKVWWKCQLGHEWRTAISKRTGLGSGCPKCAKGF